ncbi:MAG: hypothetical protein HC881_21240 [Leptolyngbyaceae cyanobacterium SL_7_1]|nr:hypothetical protein [Leptolyngbyaceae cyanobacterium SL_7_1]
MLEQSRVGCSLPAAWKTKLETLAQRSGKTLDQVVLEAIDRYLQTAAALDYEDVENEPDEILWDFVLPMEQIPQSAAAASSRAKLVSQFGTEMTEDDIEDEPDEILYGFLEDG